MTCNRLFLTLPIKWASAAKLYGHTGCSLTEWGWGPVVGVALPSDQCHLTWQSNHCRHGCWRRRQAGSCCYVHSAQSGRTGCYRSAQGTAPCSSWWMWCLCRVLVITITVVVVWQEGEAGSVCSVHRQVVLAARVGEAGQHYLKSLQFSITWLSNSTL